MFEEAGRRTQIAATDDPVTIEGQLAALGIGFERLPVPVALPADADEQAVLTTYAGVIDGLKQRGGFESLDVFRLLPNTPDRARIRTACLAERTHDSDEIGLVIEGGGTLFMRVGSRLAELRVRPGDMVRLPAGTRHWFEPGERPICTTVWLHTRPGGWLNGLCGAQSVGRFLAGAS